MSEIKFKSYGELDISEALTDASHVIIEDSGDVKRFPAKSVVVDVPNKLSELQNDLFYVERSVFATLTDNDMTWNDNGTGMGHYSYQFPNSLDWLAEDTYEYRATYMQFGAEHVKEKGDVVQSGDCFIGDSVIIYRDGRLEFFADYMKVENLVLIITQINMKKIPSDVLDLSTVTCIKKCADDGTNTIMSRLSIPENSYDTRYIVLRDDGLQLMDTPIVIDRALPVITPSQFALPAIGDINTFEFVLDSDINEDAEEISNAFVNRGAEICFTIIIAGLPVLLRCNAFGEFTGVALDKDMALYGVRLKSYENYDGYTVTVKRYF